MKKIIITFLILVTSCGYQPLYLNKDPNKLIFKEIKLLGDKNINRQIISTISIKEDKENFTFEKVTLKNRENIIETSKDSKGQPVSFKMIIILDFEIKLGIELNKDCLLSYKSSKAPALTNPFRTPSINAGIFQ